MKHRHTVKYTYRDGKRLPYPESWCGRTVPKMEWAFVDAQHVALAAGGSIEPCKDCIRAIINALESELKKAES